MSIIEVAKRAGVSKSAVSRALNNDPWVSDEARRLIAAAANELDYALPARRRGPKPKKTRRAKPRVGRIAVIIIGYKISDIYDSTTLFPQLLAGIEKGLAERQMSMLLFSEDSLKNNNSDNLNAALADGVILIGRGDADIPCLRPTLQRLPVVVLAAPKVLRLGNHDRVYANNAPVGTMAADYLAARGHRHIAIVNPYPKHEIHDERQTTFLKRAGELHIKADCFHLAPLMPLRQLTLEDTVSLVERYVSEKDRATGLFVTYCLRAEHAYFALRRHGVEPERDVEIVTADNVPSIIARMSPPPAVIDRNNALIGERGVEQLLWRIEHPGAPAQTTLIIEPTIHTPERL